MTWRPLLLFTLTTPTLVGEPFPFFEPRQPPRPVQILVHRGLRQAAPENTRRAIDMCIEDGYEWVEIDVRRSKDGVHILCHDERLDRTTDGQGAVRDHDWEQLRRLDAGQWFAARFEGTRILSLADALAISKGRVNLCLDCKDADASRLVQEIVTAGMEKQVVLYATPSLLAQIRAASNHPLALMTKWKPALGNPVDFAQRHHLAAVEVDAPDVTPEIVRAFKTVGVKTQAKVLSEKWDHPASWKAMFAAGVDWIQTDKPVEVLAAWMRYRFPSFPVRLACHRGASRYAPENTIPAIELAARLGADYIEIDLRTTKDGRHYVLHDSTLNRTTTGQGPLRSYDASQVEALDAGRWFAPFPSRIGVPSLESALHAMGTTSHAYLDAKDISPESLANILRQHHLLERSVVYQSADYLEQLKMIEPRARVMPPLRAAADLEPLLRLKPYAVDVAWRILSKDLIAQCHRHGILVFSDALGFHETIPQYRRAIEFGIDVIQTDHPARLLRAIEQHLSQP